MTIQNVNQREVRTQIVLDNFSGMPGEWHMLNGLLSARSPFDPGSYSYDLFNSAYDCAMISERMKIVEVMDKLVEGDTKA